MSEIRENLRNEVKNSSLPRGVVVADSSNIRGLILRKVAAGAVCLAGIAMFVSCDNDCIEKEGFTVSKDGKKCVYTPIKEDTKPQKQNATVVYDRGLNPFPEDLINAVRTYKDSLHIDTVFFEVRGDWTNMSANGGNNQMNNVFYPVFSLPVNVWGKGTFGGGSNNGIVNFSEEAKQFLLTKGYTFSL